MAGVCVCAAWMTTTTTTTTTMATTTTTAATERERETLSRRPPMWSLRCCRCCWQRRLPNKRKSARSAKDPASRQSLQSVYSHLLACRKQPRQRQHARSHAHSHFSFSLHTRPHATEATRARCSTKIVPHQISFEQQEQTTSLPLPPPVPLLMLTRMLILLSLLLLSTRPPHLRRGLCVQVVWGTACRSLPTRWSRP